MITLFDKAFLQNLDRGGVRLAGEEGHGLRNKSDAIPILALPLLLSGTNDGKETSKNRVDYSRLGTHPILYLELSMEWLVDYAVEGSN
jgi:hypothetical protein